MMLRISEMWRKFANKAFSRASAANLLMIAFMCVKIAVLIGLRESTETTRWIEFFGVISLIPISALLIKDFINSTKDTVSKESVDKLVELENFLDSSSIISKADAKGKITYVNQKFTEISGYSLEDVLGKDHNIVNSNKHSKEFWGNMYKTVVKDKKIWITGHSLAGALASLYAGMLSENALWQF